jgi:hypothetical protein
MEKGAACRERVRHIDRRTGVNGVNGGDRGDMVVGWLSRIVLVLAVIAVIGYDAIVSIQSNVTASDQATTAAQAAVTNYTTTKNVQAAYQAALESAKESNPANTIAPSAFTVSTGGIVNLTVTRPIRTLVAHYLPISSAKTAVATGTASPSP